MSSTTLGAEGWTVVHSARQRHYDGKFYGQFLGARKNDYTGNTEWIVATMEPGQSVGDGFRGGEWNTSQRFDGPRSTHNADDALNRYVEKSFDPMGTAVRELRGASVTDAVARTVSGFHFNEDLGERDIPPAGDVAAQVPHAGAAHRVVRQQQPGGRRGLPPAGQGGWQRQEGPALAAGGRDRVRQARRPTQP